MTGACTRSVRGVRVPCRYNCREEYLLTSLDVLLHNGGQRGTWRQGRQPDTSCRSVATARSRWSLSFVEVQRSSEVALWQVAAWMPAACELAHGCDRLPLSRDHHGPS